MASRVYLDYARVIGCLRPGTVDISIHYRAIGCGFGRPRIFEEGTLVLSIDLFTPEMRRPNTEIWLVFEEQAESGLEPTIKVLPREGFEYPAAYRHLLPDRCLKSPTAAP
jgi:hypothetical protein